MTERTPQVGDRITLAPGTAREYIAVICAVRERTVDIIAHGTTRTIARADVKRYLPPVKRAPREYDPQRLRSV